MEKLLRPRCMALAIFLFLSALPIEIGAAQILRAQSNASAPSPESSDASWFLFGGFGAGFTRVSSGEFNRAPSGYQAILNANATHTGNNWVLETGTGWMRSQVNGTDSGGREIRIRTRAGLLEFSPRFRLSERWQLGPTVQMAFGADTDFSPTVDGRSTHWFAGSKVVYEIPFNHFKVRFWSQVATDISISERRALLASSGLQIGIPFQASPRSPVATPRAPDHGVLRILLDPQRVFFATNSTRIRPEIGQALHEIGVYLAANRQNWAAIEINGHADQRGRFDYNLKLSRERAESVRQALLAGGAPPVKLQARGFSYLQPINPENDRSAWALNRRVELVFHQVPDPATLLRKLEPLTRLMPNSQEYS